MKVNIKAFTFNSFEVNTYVIWDDSRACVLVDPGCNNNSEEERLESFIEEHDLKPVHLINTHFHIDHVLGNAFVSARYGLGASAHPEGKLFWETAREFGSVFGLNTGPIPPPVYFLNDEQVLKFGHSQLRVASTPGHADGSICLICDDGYFVVTGDVLFYGSIGRTDLPTGNFEKLKLSIEDKLFTLPPEYTVYPGHGPQTSIGFEKMNNPFL